MVKILKVQIKGRGGGFRGKQDFNFISKQEPSTRHVYTKKYIIDVILNEPISSQEAEASTSKQT